MSRLTYEDIVPNYYYDKYGDVAERENTRCDHCGQKVKTGDFIHSWLRYSNKPANLGRTLQLCDTCTHQVKQLQLNQPR